MSWLTPHIRRRTGLRTSYTKNDRSLLHTAHPEGPAMELSGVCSGQGPIADCTSVKRGAAVPSASTRPAKHGFPAFTSLRANFVQADQTTIANSKLELGLAVHASGKR